MTCPGCDDTVCRACGGNIGPENKRGFCRACQRDIDRAAFEIVLLPHVLARALARCVICGRDLRPDRIHVDTCGERCFKALLVKQRAAL
jgi:hypothetical protein